MTTRYLRCEQLSKADDMLLRSLLLIVAGRTIERWEYGSIGNAVDLLVVPKERLDRYAGSNQARFIVPLSDKTGVDSGSSPLHLSYPFRPQAVIALLDGVSRQMNAQAPAMTLADSLYDLIRGPGDVCAELLLGERTLATVDLDRQEYSAGDPDAIVRAASRQDVHTRYLSSQHKQSRTGSERPLRPLCWSVGLAYTKSIVSHLGTDCPVAAKMWPDFMQLPHNADQVRMMARLARQPCSASTLAQETSVPLVSAIGFINAVLLGGYGNPPADTLSVNVKPAHSVGANAGSRTGLLSRIRMRLGL